MANGNFFPMSHFKAVLKRRSIMIKRSVKSIISSIIGAMIFSIFVIGIYWLMMSLMKSKGKVVSFDRYKTDRPDLVFIGNSHLNDELAPHLAKMQLDESGLKSTINKYQDVNTFNDQLYDNFSQSNFYLSIPFGININRDSPTPYDISLLYNSTPNTEYETTEELNMIAFVNLNRAIWKMELGEDKDFEVINHPLTERSSQSMFGYIGPLLIICGLLTVIPLIMTQPNTDIQGETRSFMQSCTLKLAPYWVATFLIDFCIWVIITTLMWGVFNIGMIVAFHDNLFNSWYALVMAGPSFILFIYVLAFIFKKPDSASRQAFLILVLTILIPLIVQMLRQKPNPIALDWIYSLFPHIALQQLLGYMLGNVGSAKQNLSYYFKWTHSMPLLIMQIVDIPIYIIIITIIEATRTHIQRKLAKMSFGGYSDFFKQAKSKHFVSQEALVMENEVHLSHDYAVRVEDVSRLFINTAGEPIPAVNNVSLGVKEGSLFGFLGANGAGKTTLIRMITGLLSASSGSIEIFGVPIEDVKDRTVLSICPQFNNHLFNELTPREHFQIYSYLFQLNPKETEEICEKLISTLELSELGDIPIRELSGGDVRKLAIALSFLGPAKIVLLDEPTASLDPVACHHVHEMIMENKGTKTFMLCTHLLSEAENLCDMISIMVKGNVYTVGSPQYLANKFGTEYKIDVMLDDESEECSLKCDTFFSTKLPIAEMSIKRPKARIYSIPANEIELHELFTIMQEGADDNTNSGFSYYTCSSSSLERVFMEIVKMSENNENQQTERDEKEKDSSEGVYESIQNSAALRNSQLSSASIGKASNIRDTVGIEDNIDDSNSYSSSSSSSSAEGVYRSNLA